MIYTVTVQNPHQVPFCVGAVSGLDATISLVNVNDNSSVYYGERPSTETDVVLPGDLDLRQRLSSPISDVSLTVSLVDGPHDDLGYLTQDNTVVPFTFDDPMQAKAVASIYDCRNKTIGQAIKSGDRKILTSEPSGIFRIETDYLSK